MPFTVTLTPVGFAAAGAGSGSGCTFRTLAFASPLRNWMPLSRQVAAMKMFSSERSVIPFSRSNLFAASIPSFGFSSFMSATRRSVGSRPIWTRAASTTSGSGGTGVRPKWPSTIFP